MGYIILGYRFQIDWFILNWLIYSKLIDEHMRKGKIRAWSRTGMLDMIKDTSEYTNMKYLPLDIEVHKDYGCHRPAHG